MSSNKTAQSNPAPAMKNDELIVIRGLCKSFPIGKKKTLNVLNHVDCVIHKNEKIAVIGPSGSGKSTFMRIIADSARKAGMSVEYIHCSGDPDSLDGIRIPEKHIAELLTY